MKNEIKAIVFDLDGTLYLGQKVFPEVRDTVLKLKKDFETFVLTNNSSVHPFEYEKKLSKMNYDFNSNQIVTSTEVSASYLIKMGFKKGLFLLNGGAKKYILENFPLKEDSKNPEFILIGFCTEFNYQDLMKVHEMLLRGIPYFATNPDKLCPKEKFYIPDAGCLIKYFQTSCGRKPKVLGKPTRICASYLKQKIKYPKENILIVGDRLYTDIKMAISYGFSACLVLSGETQRKDLKSLGNDGRFIVLPSAAQLEKVLFAA